jgi:hypothetical protein
MDYDIVRDARKVHVLSQLLCKIFRKLGKEKFTESYNKAIDSGDEDELLISLLKSKTMLPKSVI